MSNKYLFCQSMACTIFHHYIPTVQLVLVLFSLVIYMIISNVPCLLYMRHISVIL
jgi:hypothetical protein